LSSQRKASEKIITLNYPVKTLEGIEVLPAGARLTDELMAEVAANGRNTGHETGSLLDHGSVRDDLRLFIRVPPYNKFFTNEDQIQELFRIMSDTVRPVPVLDTLVYFKHHDFYTYQHILAVLALSISIARDLSLKVGQIIEISRAGTTHNIGKICVPVKVLKKKTPLTSSQRDMIDHHMAAGFVLLCHYLGDPGALACRSARDHHERADGSGGPCGIRLSDPMVEIISVADIYDALISPRSYRPVSYDNRSAIEIITEMAEKGKVHWEPVKAVVARNRLPYRPHNDTVVSNDRRGTSPPGNMYDTFADE
jgi:HD-GYP domain-containing protein (c-di-GMP phosphodiesterase class II)